MADIPESTLREIERLIQERRRIEAIKVLRAATGASLRDSKHYVEAMDMGEELPPLVAEKPKAKPKTNQPKLPESTHPQVHSTGCGSSVFLLFLFVGAVIWIVADKVN